MAMHEHHHRKIQRGGARAAVFGISDGLVSNVGLILGMAAHDSSQSVVRLAGLAALVSGAFSMASGEYVSMRAHTELLERELELERVEIGRRPDVERRELAAIYRSRGIAPGVADDLAREMHRDPAVALEAHAREELGIDPGELGSPLVAAFSSFAAFALGALLPLLPWFFGSGTGATWTSVGAGLVGAIMAGAALAVFTDRRPWRPALRQLSFAMAAAAVGYVLGSVAGGTSTT